MASILIEGLEDVWVAGKSYLASGDTDCRLSNPSGAFLFFDIVSGGGTPAGLVRQSQILGPKQFDKFQLLDGERISFGGKDALAVLLTG